MNIIDNHHSFNLIVIFHYYFVEIISINKRLDLPIVKQYLFICLNRIKIINRSMNRFNGLLKSSLDFILQLPNGLMFNITFMLFYFHCITHLFYLYHHFILLQSIFLNHILHLQTRNQNYLLVKMLILCRFVKNSHFFSLLLIYFVNSITSEIPTHYITNKSQYIQVISFDSISVDWNVLVIL